MNSPFVMRPVRVAYVTVLGKLWMPTCDASTEIKLSDYDLENIGEFNRENVEQWLMTHTGDFSQVIDFTATCGEIEIPWSSEDNEIRYLETLPDEADF
jgi:hypothetical protein